MSDELILQEGRRAIAEEAAALQEILSRLDERFCDTVKAIANCRGKIVTTALGKSGFVARKLASTLASLGTPAVFVHPTEGIHGDLGVLTRDDLIIAISHSGNSDELISFLDVAKLRFQVTIIALVGTRGGMIDAIAGTVLETGVTEEACALGLAPTTSSTAALALADAVAVAVSKIKGFKAKEFAALHPAGALGRRLYTSVETLMRTDFPRIGPEQSLREVVKQITLGRIGLVLVEDTDSRIGMITDGDIRRAVQADGGKLDRKAAEIMSAEPKTIRVGALGMDALMEMERERVTSLIVLDKQERPVGIVHLHDILRHGLGLSSWQSSKYKKP
ncbi:MAG: KpsF/GutQ family sugar-phosphate isomerase [Acidobacteriota bacterium]